MKRNIFITGFSGSGKTSIAREVASLLGWRFVDTDNRIVEEQGQSIREIFDNLGESSFRKLEHSELEKICQEEKQVIATGGGIVIDECNRTLMNKSGVVICLEARPTTIYSRLGSENQGKDGRLVRPLLVGRDPLNRIISLKQLRQFSYSLADWTVHTDDISKIQVSKEVIRGYEMLSQSNTDNSVIEENQDVMVRTSTRDYPVWVGSGNTSQIGRLIKHFGSPDVVYVVTDDGVYKHARKIQMVLESAHIRSHLFVLPQGEVNKNLEVVSNVYTWLSKLRAERKHMVLAVGGGMVGDLSGYVAATYLRGLRFAQVPTTLLAMMDAALGGKTGVDLQTGKNLVGAFHQPHFVLEDIQVLNSLPTRELRSGWAENVKHGIILDESLFKIFEENTNAILSLDPLVTTEVIKRGVAIKADVVSQDENETLGIRILLNYGHTLGHAIEVVTGYKEFLHGEAVSIGMVGAAFISNQLGMLPNHDLERQHKVLEGLGLPIRLRSIDKKAVIEAISRDKKMSAGSINWVLLNRIGEAVTRNDVPEQLLLTALDYISGKLD